VSKILAIDAASLTGYAVSGGSSGVKDIAPAKNQHAGARYQKLWRLLSHLLAESVDISMVVYEEPIPHHLGMTAAEYAWGYVSIIKLWCAEHKIACRGVHISEWKKYITGKGNAEKSDVIAAMKQAGFNPIDHNHADALGIMCFATQTWGYYAKML